MEPYARENEEELNEDGTKREEATDRNGEGGVHVPRLLWHHTWDLVQCNWEFDGLLLETKISTKEDQWSGDTEP